MGKGCLALFAIVVAIWFLGSCMTNPFGLTTRTLIKSDTQVEMTRLESDAAVQIAAWNAKARMKEAEEAAEALKIAAQEQRKANQVWVETLPFMILIVVGGVVVSLLVVYRGKALLLLAHKGIFVPFFPEWKINSQQPRRLPHPTTNTPESRLKAYAAAHNQHVRCENGYYLLVDNQTKQVVKQLALKD